jgi:hypothetical protein
MIKRYRWNRKICEPPFGIDPDKCYDGQPHTSRDGAASRMIDLLNEGGNVFIPRVEGRYLEECPSKPR